MLHSSSTMAWVFTIKLFAWAIFFLFLDGIQSSVTVEKGGRATLQCPGFTPDTEGDEYALFYWYKARKADIGIRNIVAGRNGRNYIQISGDLEARADLEAITGALEIPTTRVTDDHYYTCHFRDTASGDILNETQLIITVTPHPEDLRIFGSSLVEEGKSITYKCNVSEVKPPPNRMYLRFKDNSTPLTTLFKNQTNGDGLTSTVSVEYTLIANRIYQGKKLQCVFVTSTYTSIISSEEREIAVLYRPIGTPSIQADKESTRVNSTITLTCDTEGVDGIITYYLWQFDNGIIIKNTTKSTLKYKTACARKINLICLTGNSLGTTSESEPVQVEVQNAENLDPAVTPNGTVIILASLLGILTCVTITLAICLIYACRRNTKQTQLKQTPLEQSMTPDPHHYYEIQLQQQTAGGAQTSAAAQSAPPAGPAHFYESPQATEAPSTYLEMK